MAFLTDSLAREIELTQGQVAIVDDEDFDRLSAFNWFAQWAKGTETFYANRRIFLGGGKILSMHRVVTSAPSGMFIDHINKNTLDNRKANLRVCTNSENQRNRGKPKNNKSGFKGVSFSKDTFKWRADIMLNKKQICLGYFSDLHEAARAYDSAALEIHGAFARLNFPTSELPHD